MPLVDPAAPRCPDDPVALIAGPAWRLAVWLARLRRAGTGAREDVAAKGVLAEAGALRLHPAVPPVVGQALADHLARCPALVARGALPRDHDALLIEALRPRGPGWQVGGVVALLLAAGDRAAARALAAALPRTGGAASRRASAARALAETGVFGQGAAARVVLAPGMLPTGGRVSPAVLAHHHRRALCARAPGAGPALGAALAAALAAGLAPRHAGRAAVWAAAGAPAEAREAALAALPHARARDQARALCAQRALLHGDPDAAEAFLDQICAPELQSDAAALVADLAVQQGACGALARWWPRLDDRRCPLAALFAQTAQGGLDPEDAARIGRIAREAPALDRWWALVPPLSPAAHLAALVQLPGRRAPLLRRLLHAPGLRQALARRLPADREGALVGIAQTADGEARIADPLLAAWLGAAPGPGPLPAAVSGSAALSVSRAAPVPPADLAVALHSLARRTHHGFVHAWGALCGRLAARPGAPAPGAWLVATHGRLGRWPSAWELGAAFPRAGVDKAGRRRAERARLSTLLRLLGLPERHRAALHRGLPWCRLIDRPARQPVGQRLQLHWLRTGGAAGLFALPPARRGPAIGALVDPLQAPIAVEPRRDWTPPVALVHVVFALAPQVDGVVGLIGGPDRSLAGAAPLSAGAPAGAAADGPGSHQDDVEQAILYKIGRDLLALGCTLVGSAHPAAAALGWAALDDVAAVPWVGATAAVPAWATARTGWRWTGAPVAAP